MGVCPFGVWDESRHQCTFLEVAERHGDIEIHRCGKYTEITAAGPERGAHISPAFGSGCCSPLGNTARQSIIRAINESRISLTVLDSTGIPVQLPFRRPAVSVDGSSKENGDGARSERG